MKPFREPTDEASMYERMLAGDWYIADDPAIQNAFRRALREQDRFNRAYPEDIDAAQDILRGLLGALGDGAHVRAPLTVDYGSNVFIGAGTFVNFGLTALDPAEIRIGRNCQLGPNIQMYTPIHPLEAEPRRAGWEAAEPITIGDNVWIGGSAVICPGVTIGEDSVIGAGAVVTRSIPPRSLAVGSPARVVRDL